MNAGALANLLYTYQREAVSCPARFTHNVWSRQTGKSHAFSLRRVLRGLERSRNQIFLSAGKTQSRELMMKAETHLRALQVAVSGIEETKVVFDDIEFTQMEIRVPSIGPRDQAEEDGDDDHGDDEDDLDGERIADHERRFRGGRHFPYLRRIRRTVSRCFSESSEVSTCSAMLSQNSTSQDVRPWSISHSSRTSSWSS